MTNPLISPARPPRIRRDSHPSGSLGLGTQQQRGNGLAFWRFDELLIVPTGETESAWIAIGHLDESINRSGQWCFCLVQTVSFRQYLLLEVLS